MFHWIILAAGKSSAKNIAHQLKGFTKDGDMTLICISEQHQKEAIYKWYKDGLLIRQGRSMSVLYPNEKGNYQCKVVVNKTESIAEFKL